MEQGNKKKRIYLCVISFLAAFACMFLLYYVMKIAPFGNRTVAWEDADIQYLDFFSFFQDVLHGNNRIIYSMTNTLGNCNIGLYSYYLASPLNFLVVFFEQSQLHIFFSLLIAIKISLASLTACYYLQVRFDGKIQSVVTVLLSLGYALMQYNLAQNSNIMWLDGVYMLPLILLGVYKLVEKKKMHSLAIAVALSILFNWYTAGINCLFSIFYVCIEYGLYICKQKTTFKMFVSTAIQYGIAMFTGVCMSMILFLPTIWNLRGGKGSSFNFELIRNEFGGNVLSVVRDYTIGGCSTIHEVSLFAGSVVLLGCIAFFFNHNYKRKQKLVIGLGLAYSILIYFYNPAIIMFSLFKDVTSYWYRYSYISIFFLVFIAGLHFSQPDRKIKYWLIAVIYIGLYSVLSVSLPKYPQLQVCLTIVFLAVISVSLHLYMKQEGKYNIVIVLFVLFSVMEMEGDALFLSKKYTLETVDEYKIYVDGMKHQLEALKKYDSGTYRLSQLQRRRGVAHLDESMGYNYWGNTGYTSCPDNLQLILLDRLGYKADGGCLNVVSTSVIPSDSLLGVKYIISSQQIDGLIPVDCLPVENGKAVYENPYCLPMACSYTKNEDINFTNPFEYQNELYSELCGEPVTLYSRLDFQSKVEGNTKSYFLQIPDGNYSLYGNIVTNGWIEAKVTKQGSEDSIAYSGWLSRSVFYIEHEQNESNITILLEAEKGLSIADEQFYVLNLDVLQAATEKIKKKQAEQLIIENGHVSCIIQGTTGEDLYLAVPFSTGWDITCNGEQVEPRLFAECMISIPLRDGENRIEMTYRIPHMKKAVLLSGFGVCILVMIFIWERKRLFLDKECTN